VLGELAHEIVDVVCARVVEAERCHDRLDRLLDGLLDVEADDFVGLVGVAGERACGREVGSRLA